MYLCKMNSQTLLSHSRRPDLKVSINGRIDIAAGVAHKLRLHRGDVIDVSIGVGEIYLFVKHRHDAVVGRHEGTCFPTSLGDKGTFRTYSKRLAKSLYRMSACHEETKELRLPCGQAITNANGETLLPIIIHNHL